MEFLAGQDSQEVTQFTGPRQTVRPNNLPPEAAVTAINIRYTPDALGSRFGWGFFRQTSYSATTDRAISAFYNWLGADFNRLIMMVRSYINPPVIRSLDLISGDERTLRTFTQAAEGMSVDSYGSNLFIATHKYRSGFNTPVAQGVESIVVAQDPLTPGNFIADQLFIGAPNNANFTGPTYTPFGSGSVTAGVHYVDLVVTTRSGQVCARQRLGWNFTATANNAYTIQFTVNVALPAEYYIGQLAITEAGAGPNGRYYIVPDLANRFVLSGGGNRTYFFSMSDGQLNEGTDTTEFEGNFFQNQVIAGITTTFNPYIVKNFEDRMIYVGQLPVTPASGISLLESTIMISDSGLPQSLSLARSVYTIPGRKPVTAVETIRNTMYIFGPTYTYAAFSATGDPVTWATPQTIDLKIGAVCQNAVAGSPSRGIVFVANQQGIWVLNGSSYASKPLTFYCDDWNRIDFSSAILTFKMTDDPHNQRLLVRCSMISPIPAIGAAETVLVFDYQNGLSAEAIRYSAWSVNSGNTSMGAGLILDPVFGINSYAVSRAYVSGGIVQGYVAKMLSDKEVVFSGYNGAFEDWGPVSNTPVASIYEHAPLPTDNDRMLKLNGFQARMALLTGNVTPTVYAKDGTRPIVLDQISGTGTNPEQPTTRIFSLQSEGVRVRFDGVGGWLLEKLEVFWGKALMAFRR